MNTAMPRCRWIAALVVGVVAASASKLEHVTNVEADPAGCGSACRFGDSPGLGVGVMLCCRLPDEEGKPVADRGALMAGVTR